MSTDVGRITRTVADHLPIDYDHRLNRHSVIAPQVVLPLLFEDGLPESMIDVGCGIGTWACVASELGVPDVVGVDGSELAVADLLIPRESFTLADLTQPWSLNRRFELALCLEVAEHLEPGAGDRLIDALTSHADRVVFSAACPDQVGQHHVNCQWPAYWQARFNTRGFACSDAIRWRIWNDYVVDVWYRQNMFVATRDAALAGREARICAVVHPEFLEHLAFARASSTSASQMEHAQRGGMPMTWYATFAWRAAAAKLRRHLHRPHLDRRHDE